MHQLTSHSVPKTLKVINSLNSSLTINDVDLLLYRFMVKCAFTYLHTLNNFVVVFQDKKIIRFSGI